MPFVKELFSLETESVSHGPERRSSPAGRGLHRRSSRDLIAQFSETIELTGKPAAFITMIPNRIKQEEFARSRAPVFDSIEEAVGCLAGLRDHYLKLERLKKESNP